LRVFYLQPWSVFDIALRLANLSLLLLYVKLHILSESQK
nr:hypothetical protein [Tanacetum cinerariifolium]